MRRGRESRHPIRKAPEVLENINHGACNSANETEPSKNRELLPNLQRRKRGWGMSLAKKLSRDRKEIKGRR